MKHQGQLPVKKEDCQFFTQAELTAHSLPPVILLVFSTRPPLHTGSFVAQSSLLRFKYAPFTAAKPKQLVSAAWSRSPAYRKLGRCPPQLHPLQLYPLLTSFPRARSQPRSGSATYRSSVQQYTRPAACTCFPLPRSEST
jgi:hypothetical protein